MAVIPTRQCDRCGAIENKKIVVVLLDAKRSDGLRTIGDLCTKCLTTMEREYGLSSTERKRRSSFTVVED